MALDQAVKAICDALDGLANAVYEGKKDDQALIDKGWRSNLASIVQWSAVWINVLLTMLSVSAPVWLGWVATKQIAQRFRLAEDYAYKASISNAYEGYRREAVNLDASFQTRLFDSALTRLDETPGRLVEAGSHGSPLHELLASDVVSQAVKAVPSFAQDVKDLAVSSLKGLTQRGGMSTKEKSSVADSESQERGA